jgi:hypothetical protein
MPDNSETQTTLEYVERKIKLLDEAYDAVCTGSQYSIDNDGVKQTLTRQDAMWIATQLRKWKRTRLAMLGKLPTKLGYITPRSYN